MGVLDLRVCTDGWSESPNECRRGLQSETTDQKSTVVSKIIVSRTLNVSREMGATRDIGRNKMYVKMKLIM